MPKKRQRNYEAIEYEADGNVHQGTFSLSTGFGQKSAALNRSGATVLPESSLVSSFPIAAASDRNHQANRRASRVLDDARH
jgi:hypothetical protein